MPLLLSEAERVIKGAIAKARELEVGVAVAVCDGRGHLIAFKRMDGALWASVNGSQCKAVAAVAFARPSSALQECADSPIARGIMPAHGGNIIPSIGTVPIMRDGIAVGA